MAMHPERSLNIHARFHRNYTFWTILTLTALNLCPTAEQITPANIGVCFTPKSGHNRDKAKESAYDP